VRWGCARLRLASLLSLLVLLWWTLRLLRGVLTLLHSRCHRRSNLRRCLLLRLLARNLRGKSALLILRGSILLMQLGGPLHLSELIGLPTLE